MIKACADWVRENGLIEYGGASLADFCAHSHIDNKSYYRRMGFPEFSGQIKNYDLKSIPKSSMIRHDCG